MSHHSSATVEMTANTEVSTKQQAFRFLELPGELRNEIYGHLLPDQAANPVDLDKPVRRDGMKSFTNLMATCRQIHDEAASIVYGSKTFYVSISNYVGFLNQEVFPCDFSTANFSPLNQMRSIPVDLSVSCSTYCVCCMQDLLFGFVDHLAHNSHNLQELEVNIGVFYWYGNEEMPEIFSENFAERKFERDDIWCEPFHASRKILREHLSAFLVDPFCTLRNIWDAKKEGKLIINFIGRHKKPWNQIPEQVSELVRGDSPVPNYKIFLHYFEILAEVRDICDDLNLTRSEHCWTAIRLLRPRLYDRRLHGDVESLRHHHESFVFAIEQAIGENLDANGFLSLEKNEEREETTRELIYLLQELKAALPPSDTDTSFLGFKQADAMLREWQHPASEAE